MKKTIDITKENDIKFQGPLTYQILRSIGWLFLILGQIAIILALKISVLGDGTEFANTVKALDISRSIFRSLSSLAGPLFLVANFGYILCHRDSYKKLIISYTLMCAAFIVGYELVYFRYGLGLMLAFDVPEPMNVLDTLLKSLITTSFSFNVFIDLLLCTLVMYFLDYHPKKYFQGKKIIFFRLLTLLPLGYEIASVILKCLGSAVNIPLYIEPLIPSKPPLMILIFLGVVLFVKLLQVYFLNKGKTVEDFDNYTKTRHCSFLFAAVITLILIVISIVDFISMMILMSKVEQNPALIDVMNTLGIGSTFISILIFPFVLLFSFNKKPKYSIADKIIPIVGIILIVFVYVEGLFEVLETIGQISHTSTNEDTSENVSLLIRVIFPKIFI